jgi:hypothetical protein
MYSSLIKYNSFDNEKEFFTEKKEFFVSIGAVFKNETGCLEEWIQHYINRDIDHFFLINDGSTDNYMPIIEKYKDKITLFHNDVINKEKGKRQPEIYNKYLKPILYKTRWLMIIDLDEFIYSPTNESFKKILEDYKDYSQIRIVWYNFGSNGHIKQPKSLIKGFTNRGPVYKLYKNYQNYKCIINTNYLEDFGVHDHKTKGQSILFNVDNEQEIPRLLLNHYNIQSLEAYEKKCIRGDADNWLVRKIEDFYERDPLFSGINDTRLLEQNIKFYNIKY